MNLTPDDPRLSAYLLGELPADEAAAVERAVAADPALGLALRELENVQLLLTDTLSPGSGTLLPRQRENILRAARHADSPALTVVRKPARSLFIPLAAAAVIALAVLLLVRLPSGTPQNAANPPPQDASELPLQVALLPAPWPADASESGNPEISPAASSDLAKAAESRSAAMREDGELFLRKVAERLSAAPVPTEAELPPLRPRGPVSASENPTLPLPIHAGRASLGWITRSILKEHKRPPASAVRPEEILNHFTLRPTGAAAVAEGVTLSTESISCPWKPSATLVLVSFRGASDSARNVTASYRADPANVRSYRLLGFAPVTALKPGPLPTYLAAGAVSSLVLEIEPATVAGDLGRIEWSVSGEKAAPVSIGRHGDAEPSEDARFAALVCTYAQWLAGESSGMIDSDLVAALARETASETLAADRMDFLNLIDRSLGL